MRPKIIVTLVILAVGAAVAAGWRSGQATAARLLAEREGLRRQHGELARLQAEHGRLRDTLDEAMRRAARREAEAARALPPAPVEPPVVAVPTRLVPGEWAASSTWANRGQATAPAAVETMLWAAAGGDVASLAALLELEDATRSKAADLLARLSADVRSAFGSPEQLIAIATVKNIPVTEAQVAWFNEIDADHAVVGLMLGHAETEPATEATGGSTGDRGEPPPGRPDRSTSKLAYLTLRRAASGDWRLVVPATAVDRIARKMGAPRG